MLWMDHWSGTNLKGQNVFVVEQWAMKAAMQKKSLLKLGFIRIKMPTKIQIKNIEYNLYKNE